MKNPTVQGRRRTQRWRTLGMGLPWHAKQAQAFDRGFAQPMGTAADQQGRSPRVQRAAFVKAPGPERAARTP